MENQPNNKTPASAPVSTRSLDEIRKDFHAAAETLLEKQVALMRAQTEHRNALTATDTLTKEYAQVQSATTS